jgi:uncharacterized protein with PIN domain
MGRSTTVTQGSHARLLRMAEFRFYEELNDFLPAERRKVSFMQPFQGCPAVRDVIQAIGVPHTAIDLVLVDGRSVDFAHRLEGGERVAVYPVFERFDISPLLRLRPQPLRRTRFILDVHLGKLARYLRMLGFDCAYRSDWDDADIIDQALAEQRIILTRDIGILKQKRVSHGYWLRSTEPEQQLTEVVEALDLRSRLQPFTRCLECNGSIHQVSREALAGLVDADIAARFDRFWQCASCRKVYWRGSHYERMLLAVQCVASGDGQAGQGPVGEYAQP